MTDDNGNGRVTLAELRKDIQHLTSMTSDIKSSLDKHLDEARRRDERITVLETKMCTVDKIMTAVTYGAAALIGLLILLVVIMGRMLIGA